LRSDDCASPPADDTRVRACVSEREDTGLRVCSSESRYEDLARDDATSLDRDRIIVDLPVERSRSSPEK
jgi:hypothetical protein